MELKLESLGISQDKIFDAVVETICDRLLNEPGDEAVRRRVEIETKKRLDALIERIGNEKILPILSERLERIVLQQTNEWGEKKGESVTFVEYLTQRADAYMREPVDRQGKSKAEGDSYDWRATTTRVAFMINHHLQSQIEIAMEDALKQINSSIAKGLHEACRLAINEAARQFKVVAKAS